MTVPSTKVYVYFDFPFQTSAFTLNDTTRGVLDNVTYKLYASSKTDVTSYVNSTTIRRGNQSQLFPDTNAGTATIQLNNESRLFDPQNSSSTYFGNIIPGRRVDVESNGVLIFSGRIRDWDFTYDVSGRSVAVMNCVDGLATLATQEFDDWTPSAQLTGARISAVLDRAEVQWPYARSLDTGNATLSATAVTFGTNVLGYLNTVNQSEPGQMFVSRDGVLTFRGRHSTLNTMPGVTFSDQSAVAGAQSYLNLPGVAASNASTPDAAALDITGDLEVVMRVKVTDWSSGTNQVLMAKYGLAGSDSWVFYVVANGISLNHTTDGSTAIGSTSVAGPFVANTTYWVKATFDVDNGSGQNVKTYYYAPDQETEPTDWRTLSSWTVAGTSSIFSGTSKLELGSYGNGTSLPMTGNIYRAIVRNGIGGTTVFDANLPSTITTSGQTTFTESSAQAATVTVNGTAATVYVAAGGWNGKIPYQAIQTTYGSETLFNRIGVNSSGFSPVTVLEVDSQFIYGISSFTTPTLLLNSSAQMLDLAGWLGNVYANPEYRVSQVATELSKLSPAQQQTVLLLDLATVIGTQFTPNGVGSVISKSGVIIGMDHDISPASHRVALSLSAIDQRSFLVLNDTVLGVLDTDLLAF